MSKQPASHDNASGTAQQKLFLLFRIGEERYALEAVEIAEILPRLQLKARSYVPVRVWCWCIIGSTPSARCSCSG